MTVIQKFHYTWPTGTTPINFDEWIDVLPEPDKSECLRRIERQLEMRQQAIDRGDMILTDEGYVWKDAETAKKGKGVDDVWYKYWRRWQVETGVIFSTTFEDKYE